ncbi:hypothetical protein [Paraburkholderia humisilvae]|nr:hypothetical protein [Paraburkholderia humisilvae]
MTQAEIAEALGVAAASWLAHHQMLIKQVKHPYGSTTRCQGLPG